MKRTPAFAALLLAVFLSSCAPVSGDTMIQVCVVEAEGLSVRDNGRWIRPGESASFLLNVRQGYEILDVAYDGTYRLSDEAGYTRLELVDVRYPARVEVSTAETLQDAPVLRNYCQITYAANGGGGTDFTETYSVLEHSRPNTSTGARFARDGYTLTGWNTRADGSGAAVGLGSRVSVPQDGLTLYAQWAEWTPAGHFTWEETRGGLTITGYTGAARVLVVPERIGGATVTAIADGAFRGCPCEAAVLPKSLERVDSGAFDGSALRTLTLFDSISSISDGSFSNCVRLQTLRINAAEDPYGYDFRRESVYADKVDLLINAQGRKRLVFYGGCSMWYNLIGSEADKRFGERYAVVNMGLNGTVNSLVQMEILGHFLEEGDILFHAPELSSSLQLLTNTDMYEGDDKLWCGLEYNYDLFALVDIRGMKGVFDSFAAYLAEKKPGGSYGDVYRDSSGRSYLDYTGSVPLIRTQSRSQLSDTVSLNPAALEGGLPRLREVYDGYRDKGVTVYVSHACVDTDALPAGERDNVQLMDSLFRDAVEAGGGPSVISRLEDYLYVSGDFYDTHYHLLTPEAYQNTEKWLHDLEAQMIRDGLWP